VHPVIDPSADRPVYKQLADLLRDDIHAGVYEPGDVLPSQSTLERTHNVSTNTARDAIGVLKGEGLVEAVRGKGILVRRPRPTRRQSSTRYADQLKALRAGKHAYESAFTRDLGIEWAEFSVDPCSFRKVKASSTVADLLEVKVDTLVFERYMVLRARGQAERIQTCYYPLDLVESTAMTDPKQQPWPGGVIAELAELGVKVTAVDEDIRARMATPDESSLLGIPGGVPVFAVTRVGYSGNRPVEAVSDMVLPSDRIVLHYRIKL
jgi:GntR family transcriptional regulator